MIKLKLPKTAVILIRIIGLIALLCIAVIFISYSNGWIPFYHRHNINEYCGDDMWRKVVGNFDNVEIDNLPLKSQANDITNYYAVVYIREDDKTEWLKNSVTVASYISEYLINNPDCKLNDFESISIRFKYSTDLNAVTFSNVYDIQNEYVKLDKLGYILVSSYDKEFLSLSDIPQFTNAEYLTVDMPIDSNVDLSPLYELKAINELNLFAADDSATDVKNRVEAMLLPYRVNVIE